jgi:hypothetical protein
VNQTLAIDIAGVMPAVRATGLLSSLCTITRFPEAFDEGGAPIAATAYEPVTGMVDIPCTAPPLQAADRIARAEVRTEAQVQSEESLHVLLDDYYPDIRNTDRAVVDGVAYNIANVERDSQKQMTRIALEKVSI